MGFGPDSQGTVGTWRQKAPFRSVDLTGHD